MTFTFQKPVGDMNAFLPVVTDFLRRHDKLRSQGVPVKIGRSRFVDVGKGAQLVIFNHLMKKFKMSKKIVMEAMIKLQVNKMQQRQNQQPSYNLLKSSTIQLTHILKALLRQERQSATAFCTVRKSLRCLATLTRPIPKVSKKRWKIC